MKVGLVGLGHMGSGMAVSERGINGGNPTSQNLLHKRAQ
jgi:3-hydroxyisobutyrate dehydrogenase-like beta-hydroxyacid dehydrogenase